MGLIFVYKECSREKVCVYMRMCVFTQCRSVDCVCCTGGALLMAAAACSAERRPVSG